MSFIFPFFSFPPLLCFCLSSHTIIVGVACRMRMKSRLRLQHNKVRSQKKHRLVITLPTALSTIICSAIGLCTHLGTVPDTFQVLAAKGTCNFNLRRSTTCCTLCKQNVCCTLLISS
jgi:hypothetical protein